MNRYIFKIDIDVKTLTEEEINLWKASRKVLLHALEFKIIDIRIRETNGGYHAWIEVEYDGYLAPRAIAFYQFLLGDDHSRAEFNLIRASAGHFDGFNILFSEKIRRKLPIDALMSRVLRVAVLMGIFDLVGEL